MTSITINAPEQTTETGPHPSSLLINILVEAGSRLGCSLSPGAVQSGLVADPNLNKGLDAQGVNRSLNRSGLAAKAGAMSLDQALAAKRIVIALVKTPNGRLGSVLIDSRSDKTEFFIANSKGVSPAAESLIRKLNWQKNVLVVSELIKRSSVDMNKEGNWLWKTLLKELPNYRYVWLSALVINVFALILPLFNLAVYDRVAPNAAINTLWTLAIGVFIALIFDFLMKEARSYLVDTAARRIDVSVSERIYEHLLGLSMEHRVGAAGNTADVLRGFSSVQEFFSSASLVVLIDLPFVLLFVGLMFAIGGPLGAVPLVFGPIAILIAIILQGPLSRASKEAIINGQDRQGTLVESISNLETVRAIGAERVMRGRWQDQVNASVISGMKVKMIGQFATHSAGFLQQLASVSLIVGGVYLIASGELTMGALIAVNMLGGRAMQPFTQVASLLTRTYHARTAFSQLNDFLEKPQLRSAEKEQLTRRNLGNQIELKNMSFSYPAEQPVTNIQPCNVVMAAGERVGVIGRIGSGKTTLLKLIAGVYGPSNGAVQVGGIDTRQLPPSQLRSHVGYVGQTPMLFSGSLRENLCLGMPEATDEQIIKACRLAGVEQFVSQHPDGYQQQLGERGQGLSSGQCQSVAIAQALLQEPKILLMDEPSSAMDPSTETSLIQNLETYLNQQECSLVVISHTPALLELVDRLLVVDNGKIVVDGPKDQVLAALRGENPQRNSQLAQTQNDSSLVSAEGIS